MWRIAFALGHTQAWLAHGYRNGTTLERLLILPSWCVARSLFIAAFAWCSWWTLRNQTGWPR